MSDPFPAFDMARQNRKSRGASDSSGAHHVHYGPELNIDTNNDLLSPVPRGSDQRQRSDSDVYREPFSPLRRRNTRTATFKTVDESDDFNFDATYTERPGWQPGSEPGFDPSLPDGGHASMTMLNAPCEITVVDFSPDNMIKRHFDNDSFIAFLAQPKESWVKCRWINVNGLSWDVIQAVGTKKGLHKLALEDIMNIRNRTKADWYPSHAFIIMTLQKLVHLVDDDDSSSDSSSTLSGKSVSKLRNLFRGFGGKQPDVPVVTDPEKRVTAQRMADIDESLNLQETSMIRTLQRYHASGNETRTEFMEEHSSLAPYNLAISAEQVSIFLTSDNTVISFFEISAGDVERPIVTRISNPGTSLRESCDASLLVQAIIDAIIDLAIPLTAVYNDILGDLELDVLTSPSIKQCKDLYICISEINKMLRFLNPIDNLVNVLRDHKTTLPPEKAVKELENPASGVIVTPMTHTYLGDVLDHCIIITEALGQQKQSAENLINLIFNTISATQNESMKQLTIVTIIFLPLTFITGFFGQNFPEEGFPDVRHGIWYFWACAVPTVFVTVLVLMREMIYHWAVRFVQRKHILSIRKKKKKQRSGRLQR
ncbi:Cobalt/magnesium transport CorA-like protein [Cladobotryum mycophilum]|uniref:Cobalt/magnesium transport CorA-like protein n=1 Tax=Cladobotryum mycophilum TaxID=491253 RepID=A0ABR0SS90_9HYPO